jgi:peptidoglycan/xylan/chitin deacetylase (PgdA/CDA1 family)
MSEWRLLNEELDRWHAQGRRATLWWRDDDAVTATPALQRLLELHRRHDVVPALAVIPASAHGDLAKKLEYHPRIAVLQHGYAHKNHAGEGERAIELAQRRPRDEVIGEMARGRERLADLFPHRFLPIVVPPWNRVAPVLLEDLRELGFRALSAFSPRAGREAVPGLHQTNCHLDLIDWRGGRGCRPRADLIASLCALLEARRCGRVDGAEPTGVLTHHLDHDEECWDFLDTLLARCNEHPAVLWLEPARACLET